MHKPFQAVRRCVAVTALAALAFPVALAAPSAHAVASCSPSSSWGSNRADLAARVVVLVNSYRTGKGLPELAFSAPLTASSEWKSLHMAANGYFAHDDPAPPVARTAFQRAKECGFAGSTWGENIALGYASAQGVVNGWLGSPGHKANIDNPAFNATGVGVAANSRGRLYWTQSFGNGGGTRPAPATPKPSSRAGSGTELRSAIGVGARPAYVTRSAIRSRIAASVPFVQIATGRPVTSGSVRCRAEVEGKRLRVIANVIRSEAARCAWSVPDWAKGKRLTGVVALQIGDTAAKRLFIRMLG